MVAANAVVLTLLQAVASIAKLEHCRAGLLALSKEWDPFNEQHIHVAIMGAAEDNVRSPVITYDLPSLGPTRKDIFNPNHRSDLHFD